MNEEKQTAWDAIIATVLIEPQVNFLEMETKSEKLVISILFFVACIPAWANDGIETVQSKHGFKETVDRLDKLLVAKGITIFAKFDHSAEAQKVGLTLRPTLVYAVGNPNVGTGNGEITAGRNRFAAQVAAAFPAALKTWPASITAMHT